MIARCLRSTLLLLLAPLAVLADCPERADLLEKDILRVVTLNIAHGRGDARNQMLLREATIRENLLQLAALLDRAQADVVALQEADAASRWSGNFDHVEFLLDHSAYRCSSHGIHASNRVYDFGTALLSAHGFDGSLEHSFQPSWPTTTKGFTLAALQWNPGRTRPEPLRVYVGSVHLDFSRRSVRREQIDEMIRLLAALNGPLILMGDFNTDWQTEDSSLAYLAGALDLQVYEPHAEGLATYGDAGARLDWILISPQLEFRRYAVYPDVVSDHYAVAAEIALKASP